ncbi:zinc ABC transporter [Halorhodospira halochloris]|uniref:Zinc ABC transporter n=1 Tax=Halorhodospira halochloris TaxID=1052 RepID=A0A0X8XB91_HALHR|nr:metal ABC transporter substrate-binding protein [Halorhodospira halochloris]MBK1651820.1 zinc ABC transporter substrate-binding protein [Halorhodospira halochloris]BAU58845.1 zinc ABC transporter [Halorhodospira halochloris]
MSSRTTRKGRLIAALVATATALLGLTATNAAADTIKVAASTTNMGMLVREIGGEHVETTTMAPPDRDAHYLEARPSMMAAMRGADLLVAVGAELEEGWVPAALRGANNPDIMPGRTGYFEAAAQVELIGQTGHADRGRGDVHPAGNPHVYLDPVRMAEVGHALAHRLSELRSAHSDTFHSNAEAFEKRVKERMPEWEEKAAQSSGVVLFHENIDYLMDRLDIQIHGFIEPLPGIPPTARHLRQLVRDLEGKEGVTIFADFEPSRGAEFIKDQLGWEYYSLPTHVPVGGDAEDYFEVIDALVEAAASS